MAISQRLETRIGQSQVMTPQLQQAIELLQLSNLELAEFVAKELEHNPLLDRAEGGPEEGDAPIDHNMDALNEIHQTIIAPAKDAVDFVEAPVLRENALDADDGNQWQDKAQDAVGDSSINLSNWQNKGGNFSDSENSFENQLTKELTLRDHLLEQVAVDLDNPADRVIAAHLIDMLDDAGYFRGDIEKVAETLECRPERVTFTLLRMQHFDPVGIFARNLSECLAIQLREKNRLDPVMQKFLQHLDLIGQGKLSELQKLCGCDAEDIAGMLSEIRALNPKPAENFERQEAAPIIPDIIMKAKKGGGFSIELNSETLPRVLVNTRYYTEIREGAKKKDDKKYLAEKFQQANWLVKALHQRATTILKVASEIVHQQEAFFMHGVEYLRPLVRRTVAEEIEMHESTVSRVTTNKYISTPRGIFELRYFFTTALNGSGPIANHAAESVRHRIKNLIEKEVPTQPLSDDKLVALLAKDGVIIARRTIAKYREQMNIPSSSDRRRLERNKI
ncbi:MAG: RNA polymerase factor sigma-54 [Dongiaceae bacterium]